MHPAIGAFAQISGLIVDALADGEADPLPALDPPISNLDLLSEAEDVVLVGAWAMHTLLSLESDTNGLHTFGQRDGLVAGRGPEQIRMGREFEGLEIVSMDK